MTNSKNSDNTQTNKSKTLLLSKLALFFQSKQAIAIIFLIIGIIITLTIQNYTIHTNHLNRTINDEQILWEKEVNRFINDLRKQEFYKPSIITNDLYYDPFDFFYNFEDIDKIIKHSSNQSSLDSSSNTTSILQKEDKEFIYYQLNFDGYRKDDIYIKIENNQLEFSAKTSQSNEDKENSSKQFLSSSFLYSFRLPSNIDVNGQEIIKEDNKIIVKFKKQNTTNK